jgi:hypothetical protein
VILASAILAVMLPASTSAVAARDRPSFAGTWRLNEDSSEKLGEKMRESFRGRGGPGGDGKKVKTKTPRGDEVETSARWKDSKLVVEQNLPRGGRRTETYERASDSSRLYVTVSIEPSGRPSVTARRVYDPTEPPPTP